MPSNIITDKVKDIAPGQILSFHGFYKVQDEESYILYKNDKNFFLFVFLAPNNDVMFIETLEFRVLDKYSLFYFLSEKLDMENLLKNIKEIISLDDFDKFKFERSVDAKVLINAFYRLEKSDFLKDTPLEDFAYLRDGNHVLMFKDLNNTPVDLVGYIENQEEVFSEFGNNFGFHFIKNDNSETLLVSFHPEVFYDVSNRDQYNIVITKYNVPLFDLVSLLKKQNLNKIHIPLTGHYSYIYKLKILLLFYNFNNSNVRYDLHISANEFYAELNFTLHGNKTEKLKLMNFVSSLQNNLKSLFKDHSETIKKEIFDFYDFKIDILSVDNNHCGKIVFRNNVSLLNIVISNFEGSINAILKSPYNFV